MLVISMHTAELKLDTKQIYKSTMLAQQTLIQVLCRFTGGGEYDPPH